MKGIVHCLALCTVFLVEISPAAAQDSDFNQIQWGLIFGGGVGNPNISGVEADSYTDSKGFSFQLGLFIESQINSRLHLLSSLEIDDSFSLGIIGGNSKSISAFLGVGATLGYIRKPKSPFISLLVGYSKVDIGDTNDSDSTREPCFPFCIDLSDDRRGASSSGFGYRISVGRTINETVRWSLSYKLVGGDANDLASGSTATLSHTQMLFSVVL